MVTMYGVTKHNFSHNLPIIVHMSTKVWSVRKNCLSYFLNYSTILWQEYRYVEQYFAADTGTHTHTLNQGNVYSCARPTSVLGHGRPPTDADWSLLGRVLSQDCISHHTTGSANED